MRGRNPEQSQGGSLSISAVSQSVHQCIPESLVHLC